MAAKPFHLGWFLQGSSVQAWGEPWTGHIGETWMLPELFLDMARSLERACFDYILLEDFVLCRRELQRLDRDLPEARHRGAAAGSVRGRGADDAGDVAHRHRADVRHLCVSAVSAGAAGGDAGPGVGRARRLERGDRQLGLCGDEFRPAGHAGARSALRHGRRIHGGLSTSYGRRGSPARSSPTGESGVLVDHTKVHAVNYEGRFFKTRGPLNSGPVPAGAAGDRAGRRLAARAGVRRRSTPTRSSRTPRASRR